MLTIHGLPHHGFPPEFRQFDLVVIVRPFFWITQDFVGLLNLLKFHFPLLTLRFILDSVRVVF